MIQGVELDGAAERPTVMEGGWSTSSRFLNEVLYSKVYKNQEMDQIRMRFRAERACALRGLLPLGRHLGLFSLAIISNKK